MYCTSNHTFYFSLHLILKLAAKYFCYMFLWLGVVKVASLHDWTLTRLEFLLTNLELPHLQIKEANETNELHNTSFHFPWNNIQVQCTSTTVSHEVKHSKMTWFCTLWLVRLITDCRILQFEILTFSVQYRLRHVYRESTWFHIPATKVFWEQQVRYFYFRRRLMKAFLKVQKHLAKSWDPFITRLNLTFKKVSITIFPWIIVIPQYY